MCAASSPPSFARALSVRDSCCLAAKLLIRALVQAVLQGTIRDDWRMEEVMEEVTQQMKSVSARPVSD
jgi:hypothetical protein